MIRRSYHALFGRCRRSSPDGFTLVEMLVGLSLLALLSIMMFGGLRLGLRVWEVGGQRAERANEIEMAQRLLRRQISTAHVFAALSQSGIQPHWAGLVGTSGSLTFVAPLPAHRGPGGLYTFRLAGEQHGSDTRLLIKWQVFRLDEPLRLDIGTEDGAELARGIASIRIAYFGWRAPESRPDWFDSWEGSFGLPMLVRIEVDFPAGDPRRWPDLIVAPKLSVAGQLG